MNDLVLPPPLAHDGSQVLLAAFEHAAAGLVLSDAQGRIRRANAAFAKMVGEPLTSLPGRELVGLHADEAEAAEHRARIAALGDGALEHARFELRFEPDWDRLTWTDVAATAQHDACGEVLGISFVLLDVSERKQRDALEMQRQGLALQAAGLGLWEWQVGSGEMRFDLYWAMTLGYAVSELAPHIDTWHWLEHADDSAAVEASRRPCLLGEAAEYRVEHRMRHKEGHWVWLVDNGLVMERGVNGRPERVLGTSQDITQRKSAEAALVQSRQRQAMAVQSAKLGQWEWHVPSGELTLDGRFCSMLGYADGELPPHASSWAMLDLADQHDEIVGTLAPYLRGEQEVFCFERRLRHKRGHVVWVLDFGRVIERDARGRAQRLVGLYQDISQRKKDEEDLRHALQAADAANRAKSGFLANMSHEIRTPMNAMIGLTRLVLDTELNLRQRDYLQKVQASAKSLLGILNDILDYSKIEAGRLDLEAVQFPLEEPLNNVAALFGAQVEQKGLELFFEVAPNLPMEVVGDPMRLTQVLNNLVSNAIKFTERGQIHLKASLMERSAEHLLLRFSVSDTGIGLSQAQISGLFQAFQQADNSITRKYGGTGLGLTISQQLVGLMGGRIGVESVPGQGCTFTFTVRMAPAHSQNLAMDLHRVRGLRALVVDDQETSQLILRNLFEAWGMQADTVGSAAEGLACIAAAQAQHRPYDVVLLDWRMPGMSGLEMARQMRADGSASAAAACPPFAIMVTAYSHEQLLQECGDLPLDVVLTKPVVPSALFDILMQLRSEGTRAQAPGRAGAPHQALRHAAALRFDGARVLLVEDNLLNQEVAGEFLRGFGVEVVVANNGAEAVERVAAGRFDLVLMDMHMPVMGGVAATERIKASEAGHALPVVAMTAAVMSEDRLLCHGVGMVDFVPKPVDPDDLLRVLKRWLPADRVQEGRAETGGPAASAPHGEPDARPSLLLDLPVLAGFEPDVALRRLHGQRDRLARLLETFASSQADAQARLDELLARGEREQAKVMLHTLKGTASTLGLVALADDARRLEETLASTTSRPGTEARIGPHISRLQAALLALAPAASHAPAPGEVLARNAVLAPGSTEGAELLSLLAGLRAYLREQELVPDELLDELKRLATREAQAPAGRRLAQLNQHIFDFDHTAALAVLDVLQRDTPP